MTLYDGPLGKVFGGQWSGLKFSSSSSSSHELGLKSEYLNLGRKQKIKELQSGDSMGCKKGIPGQAEHPDDVGRLP